MRINLTLLNLTILTSFLASCSSDSGGGGGGAPATDSTNSAYTMVVDSSTDLPTCTSTNNKQLVYIKSDATFKTCDSGEWASISINGKDGAAGAAGLSITSNQLLNPYGSNICTMYSSLEGCYFNGGQIVKYSDGSILIGGNYSYDLYIPSGSNGGYAEFDRVSNSVTMLIPPEATTVFQRLDWAVSHGTVPFEDLYLIYSRTTDTITIVFDTNGNNAVDSSDEVLHTVVKSNW